MSAAEQWLRVRAMDVPVSMTMGPNLIDRWVMDPKRIGFMMARYKFAAKMLSQCHSILEVGCGDGFGTVTFLQDTKAKTVTGIDFDESLIQYANNTLWDAVNVARNDGDKLIFTHTDVFSYPGPQVAGVCSLDVWEHILPDDSLKFVHKLSSLLLPHGVAVIGTPNKLASAYASPHSIEGHCNLKSPDEFRAELQQCFSNVFVFSMSDETITAGFLPLANYLMAVCTW